MQFSNSRLWGRSVVGTLLLSAFFTFSAYGGATIYVDADAPPGGDGTSWNTAYRFLQDGLASASGGGISEIHVAQGTYKPDRDEANTNGTGNREIAFGLLNGVALMGSYAGSGEVDPDARDFELYVTILSGDLAGNDGPGFDGNLENSHNVVRVIDLPPGAAVTLDGFTIEGGNAADAPPPIWSGGAVFIFFDDSASQSLIANCTFVDNIARQGGAIFAYRGVGDIVDCAFVHNESTVDRGGALSCLSGTVCITRTSFEMNEAFEDGGGVAVVNPSGDTCLVDCDFLNNTSHQDGGGLYVDFSDGNHLLSISGCSFIGNSATEGQFGRSGGGLFSGDVLVELYDNIFLENFSDVSGGGAMIDSDVESIIINCSFIGNEALGGPGGGLYLPGGHADTIANCLYVGNTAAAEGGGLSISGTGGVGRRLANCTFANNTAGALGGGLFAAVDNTAVDNCIVWGNSDINGNEQNSQIWFGGIPFPINYSCVQGWDGSLGGNGNHGSDPLFVDIDGADDIIGTDDDDARLQAGSPCNDAADSSAVPTDILDLDGDANFDEPIPFDLDGKTRFLEDPDAADNGNGAPPIVDMGPYEFGEDIEIVEYVGPFGGSWFTPENWSNNDVPDSDTDVVIPTTVIINQPGAFARDVMILDGGNIIIQMGSLTARDITVTSGGTIELTFITSILEVRGLNVQPGGSVIWTAGTIRVVSGVWNNSAGLSIGCVDGATLIVSDGANIVAPSIEICNLGVVQGDGSLSAIVTNSGTITPGSPYGTITVDGVYFQTAQGSLVIELSGYGPGEFDELVITDQSEIAGDLTIVLAPEFDHEIGRELVVVQSLGFFGSFDDVSIPLLPDPVEFIFAPSFESMELFAMLTSTGSRLYVDDDFAGGDGQSWDTPIENLQGALAVAEFFLGQVNEIWVASGIYVPIKRMDENDPRSVTYQIIDGVSLYGGFAGTEESIDDRDLELNVTTLSGDIAGDDGPGGVNREENAHRLLFAQFGNPFINETWIDGFVVTATYQGEGGFVTVANPNFRNCTFVDNLQGQGLRINATSIVENCKFLDNGGRGLQIDASFIDPLVQNCWFEGNGGGLIFNAAYGMVRDCVFIDNSTNSSGGGLRMSSDSGSVVQCIFIGNSSTGSDGGGVQFGSVTGMMLNCFIAGNVAERYGGGLALAVDGTGIVANCTIVGNSTIDRDGGGVSSIQAGVPRLVNCTIANNISGRFQGGVNTRNSSADIDLTSCIIWGNVDSITHGEDAQIGGPGTVAINYTCVQGWTGIYGGVGNFGDNPLLIDPDGADNLIGTEDDDVRVQPGSPCIDAGNNLAVPLDLYDLDGDGFTIEEQLPIDLDGAQRFFDDPDTIDSGNGHAPIIDLGPYEFGAPIGDPGEYIGPPGGSWFNPINWAGGDVPSGKTDVIISDHVIVDDFGALAQNILIMDGGILEIGAGSLTGQNLIILQGGVLRLSDPNAELVIGSLDFQSGAQLDWIAGTIRLMGGTWNSAAMIEIGCLGQATLIVADGGVVVAPQIIVCLNGEIAADGSLITNVINSGTVAPGQSPGTLIIEGDYEQTADGSMLIELAGYEPGLEYDVFVITGTATIDGTLTISIFAAFDPLLQPLNFLTASSIVGQFGTVELPDLVDGYQLFLIETSTNLSLVTLPSGPRIYVDANLAQPGGGNSWETATDNLQGALFASEFSKGQITEVWVAAATYVPSQQTNEMNTRSVTFQLVDGLAVYGGFVGGEQNLNDRDFVNNVTILSGDINGDDGSNFANNDENAFHVITASNTDPSAVLDGFTIIGGNTLGAQSTTGAGIYCINGHPMIANCRIEYNRGFTGSGLYTENGGADLINCTFENNSNAPPGNASGPGGGAVFMNSTGLLSGTNFVGNSTSDSGGGLYSDGSNLVLLNCDFTANLATSFGGGAFCIGGTVNATDCSFNANTYYGDTNGLVGGGMGLFNLAGLIENCVFENNIAQFVGGLGLGATGTNVTITGCNFLNNTAEQSSGGLSLDQSSPTVLDCSFIGNIAGNRGGGVNTTHNLGAENNPIFEGCNFENNSATRGGGMEVVIGVVTLGQGPTLNNCTFVNNIAADQGGGISNQGAELKLNDCTFQGNTAPIGSGLYNVFDGSVFGNSTFIGANEFVTTDPVSPGFLTTGLEIGVFATENAIRFIDRGQPNYQDNPSLSIDLAGLVPGISHDLIDAGIGVAELDGTLYVDLINSFEPAIGDNFQIIYADMTVGQFDFAFFPQLPLGAMMTVDTNVDGLILSVKPVNGDVIFDDPDVTGIAGLPTDCVLGDFDDDGDIDIAVTANAENPNEPGHVTIVLNAGVDGKGNWLGFIGGSTETAVGVAPRALVSGFFNNDLSLDLAVANYDDNTISILLNDASGSGTLVLDQTYAVGNGPTAISTGLLNADNDIDLAVANHSDGNVTLLTGNGTGEFTIAATISAADASVDVALLDIDNDGDTDLVVLNQDVDPDPMPTLSVHISQGLGVDFEEPVFYDVGATPIDLLVADLNNNGFPDLVCTNSESDSVSIFVNDAEIDGLFSQAINLPIGNQPSSIASIDFDIDGDLDLVVVIAVDENESIIRLARNDLSGGTIVFSEFSDLSSGQLTLLVRSGDVDNDGQSDIIAINDGTGSLLDGGILESSISVRVNSSITEPCPWDLDGSGSVNTSDLLALFAQWGTAGPADFDGSGVVNTTDLLILFANWGPCP